MKKLFINTTVATALVSVAISTPSEIRSPATFLSATDISKVVKGVSPTAATDEPLRTVDAGGANVGIFVVHRPEEADQGCTIEHDTLANDKTTSIYFVLEGAGTIVTGGKLVNPSPLASDDPDLPLLGSGSRGTGIHGGESRRIAKGDIVIITACVA